MRIYLDLGKGTDAIRCDRLSYAFRLFCATYGYEPVLPPNPEACADVWVRYASPGAAVSSNRTVYLSDLYQPRSIHNPAPPPWHYVQNGDSTVLFYWPFPGKEPDWLGEIFEWVSCADEYSVKERDSSGRIPFSATYAGRHKLDIRIPYAAVAMRFLNRALRRVAP